jgi:hypothetical protein
MSLGEPEVGEERDYWIEEIEELGGHRSGETILMDI